MGYIAPSLDQFIYFASKGWIHPKCRIMELGSQTLWIKNESELDYVKRFYQYFCPEKVNSEEEIRGFLGKDPISEIFSSAGFEYCCCEVNGAANAIYVNLNNFQLPLDLRRTFDFVTNNGTTEHVLNQMAAFCYLHEFAKAGGYIRHNIPLFGWTKHGLMNLTPKFWYLLAEFNEYQVVEMIVTDQGVKEEDDFLIRKIDPVPIRNNFVQIGYLKTNDKPFVPPIDHLEEDPTGEWTARLLIDNMRILYKDDPLVSDEKILQTVDELLPKILNMKQYYN